MKPSEIMNRRKAATWAINRALHRLSVGPEWGIVDVLNQDETTGEVAAFVQRWLHNSVLTTDDGLPRALASLDAIKGQPVAQLGIAVRELEAGPPTNGAPTMPSALLRGAWYRAWVAPIQERLKAFLLSLTGPLPKQAAPRNDNAPATEYVRLRDGRVVGTATRQQLETYREAGNPVGEFYVEKRPLSVVQFRSLVSLLPSEPCRDQGMTTWSRSSERTATHLSDRGLIAVIDPEGQPDYDASDPDFDERRFAVQITALGLLYLREHAEQLTKQERERLARHDACCTECNGLDDLATHRAGAMEMFVAGLTGKLSAGAGRKVADFVDRNAERLGQLVAKGLADRAK